MRSGGKSKVGSIGRDAWVGEGVHFPPDVILYPVWVSRTTFFNVFLKSCTRYIQSWNALYIDHTYVVNRTSSNQAQSNIMSSIFSTLPYLNMLCDSLLTRLDRQSYEFHYFLRECSRVFLLGDWTQWIRTRVKVHYNSILMCPRDYEQGDREKDEGEGKEGKRILDERATKTIRCQRGTDKSIKETHW